MTSATQQCFWSVLMLTVMVGGLRAETWDFEDAAAGKLPQGWAAAKTGEGPGSAWEIVKDKSSPAGSLVLAQTAAGPTAQFNLCVAKEPKLLDVDITVSLKATRGKIDQGGGVVWRYQDANNYYVVRLNPLEGDFRLFHVVDSKRTMIGQPAKVRAAAGEWHTIRVLHRDDEIDCYLNGNQLVDAHDDSISAAGLIGLWTKADARTSFDALSVKSLVGETERSPAQVLVVNTGDGTTSQVDLSDMTEIKRHKVGQRPYGIAVSRDGSKVAVGVEEEECVKVYALPEFKELAKVPIGKMFNDHVILSADGNEFIVANFYSDDVVLIDVAAMKEVGRIEGCSAPHVVKYGPLRKNVYVTCKKVTGIAIVDPAERKLVKFHQLNVNPRSLTFSPDESKLYFGSFWVNGFFELDAATGKVTRLLSCEPPADNRSDQEVTYHGVEAVAGGIVLAANEGRSYVDAVDVATGKPLDRLTSVSKPCCIERIPGSDPVQVLVSNLGDSTLRKVEVTADGKLKEVGKLQVGAAPKRVAFLPAKAG